ncbi:hypothetical protein IT157_04725 [bacterium]|nr:hypothetical protein [bacterium]
MRRNLSLVIGIALLWGAALSQEKPRPVTTPFILSVNQSGIDLYRELAQASPDSNLLISPLSLYAAFSLLAPGADGHTLDEIMDLLNWSGTPESLADSVRCLLQDVLLLDAVSDSVRIEYGNSIWYADGLKLVAAYDSLMRTIGAEISPTNFSKEGGEYARRIINAWAIEKTHGRVPEPIPPDAFDDSTFAVLANALWMKMAWAVPFEEWQTKDRPFFRENGQQLNPPTMFRETSGHDAAFANLDSLKILELSVAGGKWAMQFFLPDSATRLSGMESRFSATELDDWSAQLQPPVKELNIYLPKYKIEKSLRLKYPLMKLGMRRSFGDVNLSKMFSPEPDLDLISDVFQSSFVDVSERGFEATSTTMILIAMSVKSRDYLEFRADHPFFFTITHRPTGLLVFCGRVMNPVEAN